MIGASTVPFGDLSVSSDRSDASVAAFRFSNSISFAASVKPSKSLGPAPEAEEERLGEKGGRGSLGILFFNSWAVGGPLKSRLGRTKS